MPPALCYQSNVTWRLSSSIDRGIFSKLQLFLKPSFVFLPIWSLNPRNILTTLKMDYHFDGLALVSDATQSYRNNLLGDI
ncbi:hypothetical protein CEXT_647401 [Caerostris extrusa]|uniref:Uncharacterized protein n=1 Tax=Caerostris extrusa TaxID=172846 RepID=A0AAV4NNI7_CAEEX|nr:hypothetical protein CEXT_647401 [Caerostris extrusa]